MKQRILALGARLAEVEGGYGDTIYELHRASVKADLRMSKILNRLDIPDLWDDEVDAARDQGLNRRRLDGSATWFHPPVR